MAGDKRIKSIESQSGNTEFRLSRCNIAFENYEGLYSNHIAFQVVVNNLAWTILVGTPRIYCSELTLFALYYFV